MITPFEQTEYDWVFAKFKNIYGNSNLTYNVIREENDASDVEEISFIKLKLQSLDDEKKKSEYKGLHMKCTGTFLLRGRTSSNTAATKWHQCNGSRQEDKDNEHHQTGNDYYQCDKENDENQET